VIEAAPAIDREAFAVAFLTLVAAEARAEIEQAAKLAGRAVTAGDFEIGTYAVGLLGHSMRAADYVKAMRVLQATGRVIGRFFETCDVLLTPTLALPPVPIGALKTAGGQVAFLKLIGRFNAGWLLNALGVINALAAKAFDFSAFTPLFNVTGQPAMSVPLAWNDDGLPIGMQFVGRFGDDATLFRLAGQLERARPWFSRIPPL